MLACCNGTHYANALLTVRKAGGNAIEYVTVKLETVLVSGLTVIVAMRKFLEQQNAALLNAIDTLSTTVFNIKQCMQMNEPIREKVAAANPVGGFRE
jgi:hypothetical protein